MTGKCSIKAILILLAVLLYRPTYSQTEHLTYRTFDTGIIKIQIEKATIVEGASTDSAIVIFESCLKQSEETRYATGIITSLKHLGVLYSNKGLYSKCLETFIHARDICFSTKKLAVVLPVIYNGIANIYKMQGSYEKAAKSYYHALVIADKLNITTSGSVYNNMASVQMFLKQYDKAYYYLNKAESLARKNNNYDLLASILTNRGLVFKVEKRFEESLSSLSSALVLAEQQNLSDARYNTLTNIGQVYLAIGKPQKAFEYLIKTQQVKGDINPYYQAVTLETVGVCYRDLGDKQNAEKYFREALAVADTLKLQENRMSLTEKLAEVHAQLGDFSKAYEYLTSCMSIRDSIQAQSVEQTINQLDVRYRTAEREKDIIAKQLKITQQENYLKKKNLWIWILAGGSLLISGLLLAIFRSYSHKQRLHKKQIQLLEQQQKILQGGQEIGQLKAMMQGEEKERTRIAQELHDGIGGMLTAVNMNLRALQKRHSNIQEMKELNEILLMLQNTAIEVRKTAHNLMPDILLNYSLQQALQLYCEHIDTDNMLQINLQFYGQLEQLDKFISLSLYRIIQELIQNIIKHSQATISEIQIRLNDGVLTITVEDNGIGFDKDVRTGGLGLQNVRSRIASLQGYISVESASDIGTTVYIELDVEKLKSIIDYEHTHSYS